MSEVSRRNWFFKEIWDFKEPPPLIADEFFGKAIMICANGDGELTQEEKDWIVGYFATNGATEPVLNKLKAYTADEDIQKMVEPIPDPGIHNAIIYFAIKACDADGEISDGEMATILKLAKQLNISAEVVRSIKALYREEMEMRSKKLKILFPSGSPF